MAEPFCGCCVAGGGAGVDFCFAGAVDAEREAAGRDEAERAGAGAERRAEVDADRAGGRGDAARRPPLGREDLLPIVKQLIER